jgi:hypothetical protein
MNDLSIHPATWHLYQDNVLAISGRALHCMLRSGWPYLRWFADIKSKLNLIESCEFDSTGDDHDLRLEVAQAACVMDGNFRLWKLLTSMGQQYMEARNVL